MKSLIQSVLVLGMVISAGAAEANSKPARPIAGVKKNQTVSGAPVDPSIDMAALRALASPAGKLAMGRVSESPLVASFVSFFNPGNQLQIRTVVSDGHNVTESTRNCVYGLPGDVPQFYQHGVIEMFGVWRPTDGTFYMSRDGVNCGQSYTGVRFGQRGDIPLLQYSQYRVYRPSNGMLYIYNSIPDENGAPMFTTVQYGQPLDQPIQGTGGAGIYRPSTGRIELKGINPYQGTASTYLTLETGIIGGVVVGVEFGFFSAFISIATRESGYRNRILVNMVDGQQFPATGIRQQAIDAFVLSGSSTLVF